MTKKPQIALAFALALANISQAASAADFTTTLTLNTFEPPLLDPPVDAIVMIWSTGLESGTVEREDLDNWMYKLSKGGTVVYSETIVRGGVVQPIGGVSRSFNDINWQFDLDAFAANKSTGLLFFDNDLNVIQEDAASGLTYNISGNSLSLLIDIEPFIDGNFQDSYVVNNFSQMTRRVPEPNNVLALGILGLGLFCKRKLTQKQKQDSNKS